MATPRKPASRSASPAAIAAAAAAAPAPEVAVTPPMAAPRAAAGEPLSAAPGPEASAEAFDAATDQLEAMRELLRQSSEATLEQSRAAYERLKQAAEETTGSLGAAYEVANKGLTELQMKSIDTLKANTDAAFDFVRALTGAKSLSDVVVLQSEMARKQYDAMNEQAKEFAELAKKVASESVTPFSATLGKAAGAAV